MNASKTFTFDCPNCKQSIEAEIWRNGSRVECPKCQYEFTAPLAEAAADHLSETVSVNRVDPPEAIGSQVFRRSQELKERADRMFAFGWISLIICAVLLFMTLPAVLATDPFLHGLAAAAAGFFSVSLILFLFANLTAIRSHILLGVDAARR